MKFRNQLTFHFWCFVLTALIAMQCTKTDDVEPEEPVTATSIQLDFVQASEPGNYSYFHHLLADGGVWLEGGGNRRAYYRSVWSGDTVITTRQEITLPSGELYATRWGDKVLLHTDGPQLDTGPAKVIETGGEYAVSICQEQDMRCGEGAMRATLAGLLMGAAAGPSFNEREFSLRWLGNEADRDIEVSSWPNAISDFTVGVASFGNMIMGAYYVEPTSSGTSRLVPFKFDRNNPTSSYSEGAAFDHPNARIIQGVNSSIGIANENTFAIYTMGDPLYIHSLKLNDLSNHEIDSVSKPLLFGSSYTSALGSYQRSYRSVSDDNAYYTDPNDDERELLMACKPDGPETVWQHNLRPITFAESGESLGDAGFVGGSFNVFGKHGGKIYTQNTHHVLEIEPATMRVTQAWSLAGSLTDTRYGMPSIWAARLFDNTLYVMAIQDINTSNSVILMSKVEL